MNPAKLSVSMVRCLAFVASPVSNWFSWDGAPLGQNAPGWSTYDALQARGLVEIREGRYVTTKLGNATLRDVI